MCYRIDDCCAPTVAPPAATDTCPREHLHDIIDNDVIPDPNAVQIDPTPIPTEDQAPSLRADGKRATQRRSFPSLQDYPKYAEGTPEYANAAARAARYHAITHHSARKMEWNIRHGYSLGCKPGDSQYLKPCIACQRTGLDPC